MTETLRKTFLADNGLAEIGAADLTVILALLQQVVRVDVGGLVFVKEAVGLLEVPGLTDILQSSPGIAVLLVCNCFDDWCGDEALCGMPIFTKNVHILEYTSGELFFTVLSHSIALF